MSNHSGFILKDLFGAQGAQTSLEVRQKPGD
jgi:hypothetical protein